MSRAALIVSRLRWSRSARGLAAWLGFALATLVILWPLGLTNRILGGIDAFTYFMPYWAYRSEAFRAGSVPLWNPYLFAGVPFLANPQSAVLYPLHWPLSWLSAAQALVWSALLHCWLAAGFTYTLARRSFDLSRPAAWLAGLIFGLGGFTLARIENINQLNALAWLPALLWLHDESVRAASWRNRVRALGALTLVIALQFLAGHTQTMFINMVAWAGYAIVRGGIAWRRGGPGSGVRHLLPFLALAPALLLSAAQLLPTLELNVLGLRTGGLPYRQAASFSLRPQLLLQSLLPPFGGHLAEAFASEGYAEFVGYTGVAALLLAGLGLCRGQGRRAAPTALVMAGFLLALGAYNPLYYLLWRIVPGFDLFRAPARWLALLTLGVALLAGVGLHNLGTRGPARHLPRARRWRVLLGLGAAGGVAVLVLQQWPALRTLAGWLLAGAAAVLLVWRPGVLRSRRLRLAQAGLIALVIIELGWGSRALPFTLATAPHAADLRNATATLLAATQDQPPAGRDRFLSLSDIRFDPGDLAELRALQADRLSPAAVERLVRAAKQVEVSAPNLPLLYRLPAVDGYDGGVLPLQRYVQLQGLFLPPEELVPDGRLREQLQQIPEDRLLDLTGVRFVITDKAHDLWADDVYYDLEQTVTLPPGAALTLDLTGYPAFAATALGLVARAPDAADSAPVGELLLTDAAHAELTLPLAAGREVSDEPVVIHFASDAAAEPRTLTQIVIRNIGTGSLLVRGLSLLDLTSSAHTSITLSPRGDLRRIQSGDVKVYERTAALGRAWLVHGIISAADAAAAFAALQDVRFDPRAAVVIEGAAATRPAGQAAVGEQVAVDSYDAERILMRATVTESAVLVMADAWYPGWEVAVDGRPVPLLRANLLFRGVALEPGAHHIELRYRPASWERGRVVSLVALALLMLAAVATYFPRRAPARL